MHMSLTFLGSFIQNKVSSVVFKCGSGGDDMAIARKVDLESRFTGWLHAVLLGESSLSSFAFTQLLFLYTLIR